MSKQVQASGSGISLGTLVFVLFLGLKLTNHIDWSWRWVCSPLWIPLAFAAAVMLLISIITLAVAAWERWTP